MLEPLSTVAARQPWFEELAAEVDKSELDRCIEQCERDLAACVAILKAREALD